MNTTRLLLSTLTAAPLLAIASPAWSQPSLEVTPEAQIRPRWEADSGRDGDPDAGEVSYYTMRTRLGATLATDELSLRAVFSDVRTFGEEADTRRDFSGDGIDVRIATLTWEPLDGLDVQIGRFELGLLNERLMAIANWRQPGRSFDGARVAFERDRWSLDARAYMLREGDSTDFAERDQVTPDGDDALWLSLAGTLELGQATLSPVGVYDTDGAAARDRATVGALLDLDLDPLSVRLEGYGQFGSLDRDSILAGMAGATATWAIDAPTSPSVGLQYEVLSGDGSADDGRSTAFNTLFGANHRYYGNVDMAMFQVGGFRDGQGLQDAALELRLKPHERVTLGLDNHAFLSAAPSGDGFLAYEPDAWVKVKLAKGLNLAGGANVWLPPESDEREWMGWAMLNGRL